MVYPSNGMLLGNKEKLAQKHTGKACSKKEA